MAELQVGRNVLEANDRLAEENRRIFREAGVKVVNLISSPGAGKTSLLEQTLGRLKDRLAMAVIEGDVQTTEDAQRVAACGVRAVQIETRGGCHLDGSMIAGTLPAFDLPSLDLLIIENVGNLVCPVEFDLGEDFKIAVLSVAEGDDKPAKYPQLFREAQVLIINKIDLLPYIDCDMERIRRTCLALRPDQKIFEVSCRTGEGMDAWTDWLMTWAKS